jgi:glucokinase
MDTCLRDAERIPETPEVASLIASAGDPTVVIVERAIGSSPSPLCVATIDTFVSIPASEASNLVVKGWPRFMQAFIRKRRFEQLMANIPVHVVVSHAGWPEPPSVGWRTRLAEDLSQMTRP